MNHFRYSSWLKKRSLRGSGQFSDQAGSSDPSTAAREAVSGRRAATDTTPEQFLMGGFGGSQPDPEP